MFNDLAKLTEKLLKLKSQQKPRLRQVELQQLEELN